jgi:hypothetical protein
MNKHPSQEIDNYSALLKKCIHNIRNMRKLDDEMINNIRNVSDEEKMYIIISFNPLRTEL